MTESEHRPNEEGFGGDPSTPEPEPENAAKPVEEAEGERIAVPAGDLTGSLTAAVEHVRNEDDEDANAS